MDDPSELTGQLTLVEKRDLLGAAGTIALASAMPPAVTFIQLDALLDLRETFRALPLGSGPSTCTGPIPRFCSACTIP